MWAWKMTTVRYHGHSCFEIESSASRMFVDIFTGSEIDGRPRLLPNTLDPKTVKAADVIFITNEHADHCDISAVTEISDRTKAQVVAPQAALDKLKLSDRFKVAVKAGDKFKVRGVDVEVVKAYHPQAKESVGYLIKLPGLAIYHAGDTYKYSELGTIHADLMMVPIGGVGTMDAISANGVVKEIKPKWAIPMHYDTYDKIAVSEMNEFTDDLGSVKPVILKPGQAVNLK